MIFFHYAYSIEFSDKDFIDINWLDLPDISRSQINKGILIVFLNTLNE